MRCLSLLVALVVFLGSASPVAAASISVRITSLPAVERGAHASVTVATKAGARCTISVVYRTGPSHAKGLGAKTVPASGKVSWSWKVPQNTTRGRWPVTIRCTKGSLSGSAIKYLVVT